MRLLPLRFDVPKGACLINYCALNASAGSGKTFALSVRYVALVLSGRDISKILAITFTNKATNEMKSRIIDTFLNLEHKSAELAQICELLDKNKPEILALRDEKREFFLSKELRIQTFDSFFSSILRLFCLNLGLMPDFKATIDIEDEIKELFLQNAPPSVITHIAKFMISTQTSKNGVFQMVKFLSENLENLNCEEVSLPSDENLLKSFYEFKKNCANLSNNSYFVKLFEKTDPFEFLQNFDLDKKYFDKIREDPKFTEQKDEFFAQFLAYLKNYEKYQLFMLSKIVKIYENTRLDFHKKHNLLSFSDICKLVYQITSDENYKEMLYFRLDGRILDILIDEFQDTNVLQYKIMYPLIAECVSGAGQNGVGSFFYVGDKKQSIYRFRGSKKELFDKLQSDFTQIRAENLKENYRSYKNIVDFVNSTFDGIFNGYEPQNVCEKNANKQGFVEVLSKNKDEFYATTLEKINAFLQNGISCENIAVLCWNNKDISELSNYLTQNGIKTAFVSSNLLINAKNVAMLILYAKFCYFKDERIYTKTLSEFFETTPKRTEFSPTSKISEILYKMGRNLGVNFSDKNLLRFFEIAQNYHNFVDFIFHIDKCKEKCIANEQSGVNLLSVHGSKGLQFDHVIVLDMLSGNSPNTDKFIVEYDILNERWEIRLRNDLFEKLGDKDYSLLKNKSKQLEFDDKINQIYVAFTRAKKSLCIIAKIDANGKNESLFKSYISNKNEVCFLNLSDFCIGEIEKENTMIIPKPQNIRKIEFCKTKKQEILQKEAEQNANFKSKIFGTAMHFMLEMMSEFSQNSFENAKISLNNHFWALLDEISLKDISSRVQNLLNCAEFLDLIANFDLFREQDFIYKKTLKRLDLFGINLQKNEILIIDYKSSQNFIGENFAQVAEYAADLVEIYPKFKINAYLVFLLNSGVKITKVTEI